MKLKESTFEGNLVGYRFFCPGCQCSHLFSVAHDPRDRRYPNDPVWKFDGNMESPTFEPSLVYPDHCHLYVRNGRIEFLSDCNHALAGQTVDLPDCEDDV